MAAPVPAIAGRIVSRNEMAGILGVATMTMGRFQAAGCPCIDPGSRGRAAKFNELEVRRWYEDRKRAKEATATPTQSEAKHRFTLAQAELKEFALAEKRGTLISVEEIAPIIADELANVRARLLEIPGRLSSVLGGELEGRVRDEIIGALTELTSG